MRRRLEIHHATCSTIVWTSRMHRLAVPPLIGTAAENGGAMCSYVYECMRARAHTRTLWYCSGLAVCTCTRVHMHTCARIRKRFGNTAGVKLVTSLLANIALSIAHAHARARLRLRDTLNKPWWGVKGGHRTKMINRYKNTDIEEIALARASTRARARAPVRSRVDWSSGSLSVGVFIERDSAKGANMSLHSLRGKSVSPI